MVGSTEMSPHLISIKEINLGFGLILRYKAALKIRLHKSLYHEDHLNISICIYIYTYVYIFFFSFLAEYQIHATLALKCPPGKKITRLTYIP